MVPRAPLSASLFFPRSNQYATFLGDRYHGVMKPEAGTEYALQDGENQTHRLTLLINYWRHRPQESVQTRKYCHYDDSYKPLITNLKISKAGHKHIPVKVIKFSDSADKHLPRWIRQELPPAPKTKKTRGEFWRRIQKEHSFLQLLYTGDSKINTQFSPTQVIPAWGA